jgi:hypothetical protein
VLYANAKYIPNLRYNGKPLGMTGLVTGFATTEQYYSRYAYCGANCNASNYIFPASTDDGIVCHPCSQSSANGAKLKVRIS